MYFGHPSPGVVRCGPVAFLVDETSASTSEVLAGGQEFGRVEVLDSNREAYRQGSESYQMEIGYNTSSRFENTIRSSL